MSLKRPRPGSTSGALTDHERRLLELIKDKKEMGLSQREMTSELKLPPSTVTKCLKSLIAKNHIKEIKNIQKRGLKYFISVDFEPSSEITGGVWYSEGNLDTELINVLKEQCWRKIYGLKVATLEGVTDAINRSKFVQAVLSKEEIGDIIKSLVLDNEVMEVKSSGTGEFASIPVGKVCYKCTGKRAYGGGAPKVGALASIPCGVCPQISQCTPDGIISPKTCVYYKKWLEF